MLRMAVLNLLRSELIFTVKLFLGEARLKKA